MTECCHWLTLVWKTFALLHPNEYLTDTTLPTAEFDRPVSGIITTEGITRF